MDEHEVKKESPGKVSEFAPDEVAIPGQRAGFALNWKQLLEREAALKEKLQEQYLAFHEKMLDNYVKFDREVDQVALQRMQDAALARERHEKKQEERMEELEETMTRQVATVNESIAGLIASLNALIAQANLAKGELESQVGTK